VAYKGVNRVYVGYHSILRTNVLFPPKQIRRLSVKTDPVY